MRRKANPEPDYESKIVGVEWIEERFPVLNRTEREIVAKAKREGKHLFVLLGYSPAGRYIVRLEVF